MSYLDELNDIQRQAVETINGPVMIIAGPGSGKTRVLTYRIAYLMESGIDPFNILALTFTNKASREMRERIEKIAGNEARNLWMGTFHSVFARLLRVEAPKLGYSSNFTIYDTADTKNLLKQIVKELGLNTDLYKPGIVYNRISGAKNQLIIPEMYMSHFNFTAEDEATGRPRLGEIYRTYAQRCFKAGAMDFDDLLLKTNELLEKYPEVLYKYQNKFQFLMIDEFQDTNHVQYSIVKRLAAVHENIAVVGDDAQSIYAFRGATIQNILNFKNDYPDLKVFKLEQNYRSTKNIVNIANQVIARNKSQLEKTIWTQNETGNKIKLIKAASDNEEGKIIADRIFEEKMRNHHKNGDFAILYRTNAQSRAFEEALRRMNIPYKVYGGLSFYQRKEVKDMLAYLRLTVNPHDEEALRRVINYPTRGIGNTTIQKIIIEANANNVSLWDVVSNIKKYPFNARVHTAVGNFALMIQSFQAQMEKKSAYDLALHIGKQTQLQTTLYNDKTVEGLSRWENYQELMNSIQEFANNLGGIQVADEAKDTSLSAYLQQVSLLTDQDGKEETADTVSLMTIHSAKGLEYPVVFVVGMEEDLFPSKLSLSSREDIEEERRLFYVAVTRAEKMLYLSYAAMRYRFGKLNYCEPSRFIDELSPHEIEMVGMSRPQRPKGFMPKSSSSFNKKMPVSSIDSLKRTGVANPNMRKLKKVNVAAAANFEASDPSLFETGMKVKHQRFGTGTIHQIEGEAGKKIAAINFEGVGQKRILLKFAKLQIVG